MPRKKQRENYGSGSVTPVMVVKKDRDGRPVIGPDGKPVKVQKRDKQGRLVWLVCISLGYEDYIDEDGNLFRRQRKAPQKTVHGSLADAREVAKQMGEAYETVDPDAAGMTFSHVCDAWLEHAENSNGMSARVLHMYRTHLGHMRVFIGDRPVLELRQADIEAALNSVKKSRGLSNTTMHKVFAVTKRALSYAEDNDWILRNPCARMKAPKVDKVKDRRSLTSEEAARLRACLDRDEETAYTWFSEKEQRQTDWGNLFGRGHLCGVADIVGVLCVRLLLATGMRRGEALGLTWGAVDLDGQQVTVRQSLNTVMELKEPKTKAGVRSLHVDADTMERLRRWKTAQASFLQRLAIRQTDGTPVFCDSAGGWYNPPNFHHWWDGYRKAIGFPTLKLHELRHTQATLLLGNGADIKTVQTRLGHSKSSLTLDQYAHAIPANDRAAADLIGSIIAQPAKAQADVIDLRAAV